MRSAVCLLSADYLHLAIPGDKASLVQCKVAGNENLAFLMRSTVSLLSAACLLFSNSHLEASNTETVQSKDAWHEKL